MHTLVAPLQSNRTHLQHTTVLKSRRVQVLLCTHTATNKSASKCQSTSRQSKLASATSRQVFMGYLEQRNPITRNHGNADDAEKGQKRKHGGRGRQSERVGVGVMEEIWRRSCQTNKDQTRRNIHTDTRDGPEAADPHKRKKRRAQVPSTLTPMLPWKLHKHTFALNLEKLN